MFYGIIHFERFLIVVGGKVRNKQLLFYCEVLPMSLYRLIDQHTILFYKRLQTSENKVMRVLARINRDSVGAILSKYGIHSLQNSIV